MEETAFSLLVHMDRLFAAGDIESWLSCFDESVVFRCFNAGPARGEWVGKSSALEVFLGGVNDGYDGQYGLEVQGYRSIGDDLAAMDWRLTITSTTGEVVSNSGCDLFRVRDGRVVEIFEVAEREARDIGRFLKVRPTVTPPG